MALLLSNRVKIFLDKYDLTVGGLDATLAAIKEAKDKTSINDLYVANKLGAVGSSEFNYSALFDDAATSNFLGLKALVGSDTERVLSVHLGTTKGDQAGLTLVKVLGIKTAAKHADLLPVSGEFAPHAVVEWGRVLYPKTTITNTTAGTSIDFTTPGLTALTWAYHVIAWSAVGGNAQWNLAIQESSDNAVGDPFADVESVNVTATGAARRTVTGARERYLKFKATRDATSGSLTVAIFVKLV